MPKKVIDILPPEKNEESKPISPKVVSMRPKRRIGFKKLYFFIVLILIMIGITYCSIFSKAEIEIWPEMDTFKSKLEVIVDEKIKEPDLSANIIPGCFLEEQNSFSQQFPSSGKIVKSGKAEGTIRVYNDYSALSQPLRANTRFMAASGEIFRTPTRIVIPGKKTEKGKEVSGQIDIKVVADKPGPEYNIEPTTFSIPGLVGTSLYTKFYGKSFKAMSGGFEGEARQVTEEDLEKAKIAVTERLMMEGEQILRKEAIDSGLILLEEAFWQEIKAAFSSVEVGTGIENFDFSAEVKSNALLFKEKDIEKLILNEVPENKKLYKESLSMNWESKEIDLIQGKVTLDLEFSGKIYSDIDKIDLKRNLKGKKLLEVEALLERVPGISEVKISSWPFWIKKIPRNLDRVEIRLKLTP